ncbi:MAG: TolC family protein, partial [Rhizobiales bacterium]|nr:TolC family protein [Hyphomicrobiales bacterium]
RPRGNRETDILFQPDLRLLAQQPVYSGGETVAGTARAENQVRAARARLLDVEQTVLFDVVSAYAGVVRARNVLRLSQENLDRLERYRGGTQERFRVAEVTRTDVSQADSRVAGAVADIARAESELEAAVADYQRVVGQPPEALETIAPAAELPASLDEAEALDLPSITRFVLREVRARLDGQPVAPPFLRWSRGAHTLERLKS